MSVNQSPVTRAEIEDARDTLDAYLNAMKAQYQADAGIIADYERVLGVLVRLSDEVVSS